MQKVEDQRPAAMAVPVRALEHEVVSGLVATNPTLAGLPGAPQGERVPTLRVAPPIYDTRVIDYSVSERLVWD
jgi:hypothetical protein